MSAAATPDHPGDGIGSSRSGEKESSGTMQLLDRLGYGLVSLSSSPDAGKEGKREGSFGHNTHKKEEPADDEPYSAPVSGMDPAVAGILHEIVSACFFKRIFRLTRKTHSTCLLAEHRVVDSFS